MNQHAIIQIKKSSKPTYWYSRHIGEMFHVSKVEKHDLLNHLAHLARPGEFEVISYPELTTTKHFVCRRDAKIIATFSSRIKVIKGDTHLPVNARIG